MGIMTVIIEIAGCVAIAGLAVGIVAGFLDRRYFSHYDRISRALPGLDCGACSFPQCIDYAEAVTEGRAGPCGCVPGGLQLAHAIADILEIVANPKDPAVAIVQCNGGVGRPAMAARYNGIADCRAALLLDNGTAACAEGCLGQGSCVRACPFGALSINGDGVAAVDRRYCNGCGACIGICPRNLIALITEVARFMSHAVTTTAGPPPPGVQQGASRAACAWAMRCRAPLLCAIICRASTTACRVKILSTRPMPVHQSASLISSRPGRRRTSTRPASAAGNAGRSVRSRGRFQARRADGMK